MTITDQILKPGEFYTSKFPKDKIFIHHTAGSHRPDWSIHGWNTDKTKSGRQRTTATAFVIGGISTSNGNVDFDGKIYRAFNEDYWAVHLNGEELYHLDKTSIGIELCNYGPLTRAADEKYYNYVNKPVLANQVVTLSKSFRGYKYYHRYSDKQIESLRQLLALLAGRYSINLKKGLKEWIAKEQLTMPSGLSVKQQQTWLKTNGFVGRDGEVITNDGVKGANTDWALSTIGKSAFEFNYQSIKGAPGLWTHTNVRIDKTDCSPQPHLLEMIKSF